MSFKLVAIRPLKGCSRKYLKVLKEEKAYVFYNEYDFSSYSYDYRKVVIKQELVPNLYSTDSVNINISAIVGKNGSGKSSVVELLYVCLYNISAIKKILYRENLKRYLNLGDIEIDIKVELFYEMGNELIMLQLIDEDVIIYKSIDGLFSKVSSENFDFKDFFYSIAINYSHYALNSKEVGDWINNMFHKNDAYQTPLVINPMRIEGNIDINKENYLIRSRLLANILSENTNLRELAEGKVVKFLKFSLIKEKLQEKPGISYERYRKILPFIYKYFLKDKISNSEKSALDKYTEQYIIGKVYYICHKYKQYKNFKEFFGKKFNSHKIDKFAKCLYEDKSHITFKLRQAIYFLEYGSCIKKDELDVVFIDSKKDLEKKYDNYYKILISLYQYFLEDVNFKPKENNQNNSIKNYIIERVYDICHNMDEYSTYKQYFGKNYQRKHLDRFAKKIKEGSSDIVKEIGKAVFYLKEGAFHTTESIDTLSYKLQSIRENKELDLIEIIPPSFIDIEIFFDNDKNTFERLSSGEKQKIYSISSLIYHLINLDSVTENIDLKEKKTEILVKYKYINFIFDEIELYYHPELQRTFIKDLLDRISAVKFEYIVGINCIFITHSPFILSDIPNSNILLLNDEDTPTYTKVINTFGANIHDLLKNSFFLKNGAMGDFAMEKINETINFIQYSKLNNSMNKSDKTSENLELKNNALQQLKCKISDFNLENHRKRIDIIGEPILKRKLSQMFNEVFSSYDELEILRERIARLKEDEEKLLSKMK